MPVNVLFDVVQTNEGILIIASQRGVFHYDGIEFKYSSNFHALNNNSFHYLQKRDDGRIFAFPENLLHPIFEYNGEWKQIAEFPEKLHHSPSATKYISYSDHGIEKILAITSDNKCFVYSNGFWTKKSELGSIQIFDLAFIFNKVFIATSKGLAYWNQNGIVFLDQKVLNGKLVLSFENHVKENNEHIHLLTSNNIYRFDGQTILKVKGPFKDNAFHQSSRMYFLEVNKQTIYYGNEYNVYFSDSFSDPQKVKLKQEENVNGAASIFTDRENNIWFTGRRGLIKRVISPFQTFNSKDFLPSNEVTALEEFGDNKIAIGQEGFFLIYDYKKNLVLTKIELPDDKKSGQRSRVIQISFDGENTLWLVDVLYGLGKYNITNKKLTWLNKNKRFLSVIVDKSKSVFISAFNNFYKYDNQKLELVKSFSPSAIRKIFDLGDGKIGLATYASGIFIYDSIENSIVKYKADDNLLNSVYAIYTSNTNNLLIGTSGGLCTIINNKIEYYFIGKEDFLKPIYFIEQGLGNEVWLGTDNGVTKWNLSNNQYYHYNEKNGFLGQETNRSAATLDKNERFWIGTESGLNIYDSNYEFFGKAQPKGKILYLQEGDSLYNIQDDIVLANDVESFTVEIRALSYYNETRNKFSINLFQNNQLIQNYITSNTTLRYTSLAPGEYDLRIKVIDSHNTISSEESSIQFKILAPYYKQLWFNLIVIAIVLIVFYFLLTYRSNIKYSQKLESEVVQRTVRLQNEINEKIKIEKALAESEASYRGLFENSALGIFQSDMTGKILIANKALAKMFGYESPEELMESSLATNFYIDKSERAKFLKRLITFGHIEGLENKFYQKDGSIIYLSENARLIRDNGEMLIEGSMEDITHRKLAEIETLKAKEFAEKSDRLKTEFLAQMSHEIRTPINTILNFGSLIKQDSAIKLSEDSQEYFQIMENAGKRIIRTIDLILNMSEIQTGTYEANKKKLNLFVDILEGNILEYQLRAYNCGLKLVTEIEDKSVNIFADEYTINQIFENLLNNAIKYTNKGQIILRVIKSEENKCIVEIEDTGIGISEQYLENLFDPFSQEEQGYTRRFEGNGLGLTLVKKYCEINDADITVKSEKGVGTKFRITIPILK